MSLSSFSTLPSRLLATCSVRRTLSTHSWPRTPLSTRSSTSLKLSTPSQTSSFSTARVLHHGAAKKPPPGEGLVVTFVDSEGDKTTVRAYEGDSLLDIAHANDVDLEGACEGSLACSTCHVIVKPEYFEKLEEPSDEENDMLDLAFALTETSRLGCQVCMSKDLDGIEVTLPSATRNMSVDKAKK